MNTDYFSLAAEADLEREWRWYHTRNPDAANRLIRRVDEALQKILAFPESFPEFDHQHRFVVIEPFPLLMVYRVKNGLPQIIGINHNRRSKKIWDKRLS